MKNLAGILALLFLVTGCTSTFQRGGREAAAGAFEEFEKRLDAKWDDLRPKIAAEAGKVAGEIVLATAGKIEVSMGKTEGRLDGLGALVAGEAKAAVGELVDRKIDALGDRLERKSEEERARLEKLIADGKATPMDWFMYLVYASGIGAAGVGTLKALGRKAFGLKIPVERIENGNGGGSPVPPR